jgi:hypothetical protein
MDYSKIINEIKGLLNLNQEVKAEELVDEVIDTELVVKEIKIKDTETVVYFTDEKIDVDTIVYADKELLFVLETGEYVLEDDSTIKVTEGVVNEFIPAVTEEVVEEEEVIAAVEEVIEEEPVEEEVDETDYKAKYEELVGKLEAITQELEDVKMDFSKTIVEKEKQITLKSDEIEKLNKEPITEPISKKPVEVPVKSNMENRLDTLNSLRNLKNK